MDDDPRKLPPGEPDERSRRRRGRNLAMLLVLLGLAALFYAMAMVKIAHHAG